jgi:hypothetical protein
MLRRERGQVTAEYVGVLLVAVIVGALAVAGPARRIADEAARAVCEIAGQCSGGGGAPSVDPQALQRATSDLQALIAREPDPAAAAAFFKGFDPAVADALAHERPELVGNLDGAPIPLRYAANAEAIDREIVRLRADGVSVWVGLAKWDLVGLLGVARPQPPRPRVRRHPLPHRRHLRSLELLQRGLRVAAQHRPDRGRVPR